MAGVTVRNLSRQFGANRVLDALDLDLAPGSFVALLGRSGSGKTTLLRTLAGLDPASPDAELSLPRPVAAVFQEPRLLPWKSVWRNVALGLDGPGARDRAGRALAEVGRRVPEDVSVIGFDDQPVAAMWMPALSTVHQDFVDLGRRVFGLLDTLITTGTSPQTSSAKPRLVLRESAAPPSRRTPPTTAQVERA